MKKLKRLLSMMMVACMTATMIVNASGAALHNEDLTLLQNIEPLAERQEIIRNQ